MKNQMQWLALVAAFITLIAGSLGCATMAASSVASSGDADFYNKPILSDEIVAIGRPDTALAKELEQPGAVAFIGLKNTYMLYKGGEELEHISQLKLDGKRLDIDAASSHHLFMKDKQVWGELVLTYGGGKPISTEEIAELEKGRFTPASKIYGPVYQKKVNIEGVIYPAIKLTDAQMSKLGAHRAFNLYNSPDSKPPVLPKLLKAPLIAAGVAADIVLAPVYLGVGIIVIVAAASH